jgi:hypothetical protein
MLIGDGGEDEKERQLAFPYLSPRGETITAATSSTEQPPGSVELTAPWPFLFIP